MGGNPRDDWILRNLARGILLNFFFLYLVSFYITLFCERGCALSVERVMTVTSLCICLVG